MPVSLPRLCKGMVTSMDRTDALKEIIFSYWHIEPESIQWDTPFSSQHLRTFSSLRMLRFLASVEESFQMTIEDPDAVRTFEDLREAVLQ